MPLSEDVKAKLDKRGVSSLDQDEVRTALEYDLLTESQIVTDLGLDTPAKVQAVLAGGEIFDPASVQASGNHMTLSDEEVKLIERRRQKMETDPIPTIKPTTAVDDDEDEVDYDAMTNDELRGLLADRELEVSGRKDDLIARLRESDAAGNE